MSYLEIYSKYLKNGLISGSHSTDWVFVSSFSFVLVVTCLYLIFVLIIGPRIMKNVQPLNITALMLLYNFVQIVFNIYLFYNVSCSSIPIDFSQAYLLVLSILWMKPLSLNLCFFFLFDKSYYFFWWNFLKRRPLNQFPRSLSSPPPTLKKKSRLQKNINIVRARL